MPFNIRALPWLLVCVLAASAPAARAADGGAPFTPPYGDIHHRTETLRGVSDPSIGIEWSPLPCWIARLRKSIT